MFTRRGGNAYVIIDKGTAIKQLRRNSSRIKIERFKKEIEILMMLKKEHNISNIIQIIDYNLTEPPFSYSMEACSGNSNDLLNYTKGNIAYTSKLLLPIISTLRYLSEIEYPIFHRDLKPDNILYKNKAGNYELILADFGCAFLNTDDDNRLTNEFRAVGPMAFRAPEYHHGRVDNVDEKGDIFSLGKILWYFINGITDEVFPYTLWFPAEYNLSRRFPNLPGIEKVNLLIAGMVHHNPKERIGYINLEESIKDLSRSPISEEKLESEEKILVFEENRKLVLEERQEITSNLVYLFARDVDDSLSRLKEKYPQSTIVNMIYESFKARFSMDSISNIIYNVVINESDTPLWVDSRANIRVHARIHPLTSSAIFNVPTEFPLIRLSISTTNAIGNRNESELLMYFNFKSAIFQRVNNEISPYNNKACFNMFENAIRHLIS
jgi:serine/threonine protein kinase